MRIFYKYMSVILGVLMIIVGWPWPVTVHGEQVEDGKKYIRWVDFDVSCSAMEHAMKYDIGSVEGDIRLNWIELLAYLGAKYGGDFSKYKASDMDRLVEELRDGKKMDEFAANMKYYDYYHEAYTAVLEGFLGEYHIQIPIEVKSGEVEWQKKYGLKAFSPIAKGFEFGDYDDFGSGRSYGYKRRHLGHDLFGATGTPIIAVESGVVEVMGWNRYGGWRIGIRSFDGKRYYYYAHLRNNRPYHVDIAEGKIVKAGDVIGYMGRTGYSNKENTNNIQQTHLHFGMQLIFDPSQKDGANEIWIDLYEITKFLGKNRSAVYRVDETKEYYRRYDFDEPSLSDVGKSELNLIKGAVSSVGDRLESINCNRDGGVDVPILMYHRLSDNPSLLGDFVISPNDFENDLKYIEQHGYETVTMSDLIGYVYEGKDLPDKPIVITFDDGEYSVYKYAFPLLQKYGMKAVASIIGLVTDEYTRASDTQKDINFPNLIWPQIKEMHESGVMEIQNHTYNLHSTKKEYFGAKKLAGESVSDYRLRLLEDIVKLQNRMNEMIGTQANTFVYPFGAISKESYDIIKEMGFRASLSCHNKINRVISGNPECLYFMGRGNRTHGSSLASLMSTMKAAN